MFFTQNPIGSSATEDLQDNAISFDYAMNSPSALWQDRFGKQHKTVQQALKDVGFKPAAFDFVSGGTLSIGDRDKCVFYPTDGYWYSWNGKLPYVVPANSSPTPGGKKGWGVVTRDERVVAREALRRTYLEVGLNLVEGSFEQGAVITSTTDVVLHEKTGKCYSGSIGNVPKGTDPISGGFVDRSDKLVTIGNTNFSHDTSILYEPASVGFRLRYSAYVTDAPYGAVMGANVSDYQAELNAIAFQAAVDSGVPVQIPPGDLKLKRPVGYNHILAVYPNTTIIGSGRRHGVKVTSGTEILVECPQNGQLFELKDRDQQSGDGQGTLLIQGVSFINTGSYLAFPPTGVDRYYRPTYNNVLTANTRGLWASKSAPTTDWGGYLDWRAKKDGGVDCPFLMLKDVKFQNFTFPFDVHTWMAELENIEMYLCGPARLYGTSVNAKACWPRLPLAHSWETRLLYSEIVSSSLGEKPPSGQFGGGLHNFGGAVKLSSVGAENTNLNHIACYKGQVIVDGLEVIAGGLSGTIGKVYANDAFIIWKSLPKCLYSDGTQSEFSNYWFAASSEKLLKNHLVEFSPHPDAFWGTTPWLSKIGEYTGSNFVAPFPTNDYGVIGAPFIRMPSVLNRLREVSCAHLAFKEKVILRGIAQRLTLKIHGSFSDGVTLPSDSNPRQKHGSVTFKVRPMASQDNTGAGVSPKFNYGEYSFSFSVTKTGTVKIETKHGDGFDTSKIQAYYNDSVNNGGFDVIIGLTPQDSVYDLYAQCIIDVEYEGSHNNTNSSSGSTLELVVS